MSDSFWTALPGIISALMSGYVLFKQVRTSVDIKAIHTATNSMKDELVRTTGESEKAKGKLEGAAEEKAIRENEERK